MNHSDLRTIARNLALDRDSAISTISGGSAGSDVALIANDHVNWWSAMNTDRSTYYTSVASGLLVASGAFSARLNVTNVLKPLAVTRETGSGTVDGTPVEIVSPADIYHARALSTTAGTPTMVAFVRLASASNRMRMLVHPPSASGDYFSVHYLPLPVNFTTSTVSDTEVLDLPQQGNYFVARETAVDLACILKRSQAFIDSIVTRGKDDDALSATMLQRNQATGPPVDTPK